MKSLTVPDHYVKLSLHKQLTITHSNRAHTTSMSYITTHTVEKVLREYAMITALPSISSGYGSRVTISSNAALSRNDCSSTNAYPRLILVSGVRITQILFNGMLLTWEKACIIADSDVMASSPRNSNAEHTAHCIKLTVALYSWIVKVKVRAIHYTLCSCQRIQCSWYTAVT